MLALIMLHMLAFHYFSTRVKTELDFISKTQPEATENLFSFLDGFYQFLIASNSFLIFVIFIIGILVTFRIAGPVYNMKKYFNEADPENLQEIKLRKGDMLTDLSDVFNKNLHKFKRNSKNKTD